MRGAAGSATRAVEVKEEGQMMEVAVVMEPLGSVGCGLQVADEIMKVRKGMYF